MAEAADRARWNRTQAVLAQIYNANRGKDDPPIDPMKFFPWDKGRSKPKARRITPADDKMLTKLFPPK